MHLTSSLIELHKITRAEQRSAPARTIFTSNVVWVEVGQGVYRLAIGTAVIYAFCLSPLIIISAGA